jgi:hypothetical protein
MVATVKGGGTTYFLEMERGRVQGHVTVTTVKGTGTTYSLKVERARGQITVGTVKGAGTTYSLEMEREGNKSDHGCDCRSSSDRQHTSCR